LNSPEPWSNGGLLARGEESHVLCDHVSRIDSPTACEHKFRDLPSSRLKILKSADPLRLGNRANCSMPYPVASLIEIASYSTRIQADANRPGRLVAVLKLLCCQFWRSYEHETLFTFLLQQGSLSLRLTGTTLFSL
jgi:hypothetical protein